VLDASDKTFVRQRSRLRGLAEAASRLGVRPDDTGLLFVQFHACRIRSRGITLRRLAGESRVVTLLYPPLN
jgi:hypothetical protein